jgi:hypothetical protein
MACPYFMPTEPCETELWPFRRRLPLGDGWAGFCGAPGHAGVQPNAEELKEFCNLGYARRCPYFPQDRAADAVRFSIARDHEGKLDVCWVLEMEHRPRQRGTLEYDSGLRRWSWLHPDGRVQRMADCFVSAYERRRFSH